MTRRNRWLGGVMATLAIVGCGGDDAPAPVATREQIQARLPLALTEVTNETSAVVDVASGSASIDLIGEALESVSLPDSVMMDPTPGPGPVARGFRALGRAYLTWVVGPNLDSDTDGDRLVRWLLDNVFNDASFEGRGVWRVHGQGLCGEVCSGGAAPGAPPTFTCMPAPRCLAHVDELEIRVRVTLQGSGLDFALLVGPGRDEVLDIALEPRKVEVTFDLGGIKNAIAHVARVLGENVMLPTVLEGRVRFSLTLNAPRDVTLQAAVDRAIRVEAASDEGSISIELAAKAPAISVRLRDADPMLTVQLDVGKLTVSGPIHDTHLRGRLGVLLGGLEGRTELPRGASMLTLTDLGLGDVTSELSLDGARLIGLDLNAMAGRRTALTVTPGAGTAKAKLAFEPGLQLIGDLHLERLAQMGNMDVPAYLFGQTYTLDLTGPPVIEPRGRLLQMLAGRFRLASSAAPEAVVVDAPGCLDARDPVLAGEHALLGRFRSVPCP